MEMFVLTAIPYVQPAVLEQRMIVYHATLITFCQIAPA